MSDIVDKITRSRIMSNIRSSNTKPELLIRSLLHLKGFRFRVNVRQLPGKPDIVLSRYRCVIFVNGCFWHGHNCSFFKWPKSNKSFWLNKINKNRSNDKKVVKRLLLDGWRVGVVWECIIRGKNISNGTRVAREFEKWVKSKKLFKEIV